jgi:hypothetical protein
MIAVLVKRICRGGFGMGRFSAQFATALASVGLLISTGAAHAICAIPEAGYLGGAYGVDAVTAGGCFVGIDMNGATGATTAAASSTTTDTFTGVSYSLASSANLASGVLTAYSETGIASASIWDTFTFSSLPAGGATVTATLSLSGTLTGLSYGIADLQEGPQTDFANGATSINDVFFNTGVFPMPSSISLSFNVENGTPDTVLAEIFISGDGAGGVANFGDPPTLSLSLPMGADVATASGVFANFTAVPEPSTWAMLILGFAGLGYAGYRSRTRPLTSLG